MKKRCNKKGQFYLVAAIVILAIVFGFITVSNYSREKTYTELYDLGKELQIESKNVLDYGTYNEFDQTEMEELLEDFTETYSNYVGDDIEVIFISGNEEKISVYKWYDSESGIPEEEDVAPEVCSPCEGQIIQLKLRYTGKNSEQVKVNYNELDIFEKRLNPQEDFSFTMDNSEKNELELYSGSTKNLVKKNCKENIGPGKQIGKFLVISGESNGGNLCTPITEATTICHKPWRTGQNKITVEPRYLAGHLGHGDLMGECESLDGIGEVIADKGIGLVRKVNISPELVEVSSNEINVTVDEGKEYNFKLNKGENFYFIISKEIGDETYVVTN